MRHKTEKNHLTGAQLEAFADGKLEKSLALKIAGHAADCPCCAAALAEALENASAETGPPRGFTENVSLRLSADQGRRREFRLYCVRVAACVVAAIGLMVGGVFYSVKISAASAPPAVSSSMSAPAPIVIPEPKSMTPPDERESFLEKAGNFLNQLVNSIFNPKETNDDQTKK